MSKVLTWVPVAAFLASFATTASADTICGARAIPRGSVWFLQVSHSANTICEVNFTSARGNFSGNCVTYAEDEFGDALPIPATMSGRLVINGACGFTGNASHTTAEGSDTLALNGSLSAPGRGRNERPTEASGMVSTGVTLDGGYPEIFSFSMVRRTDSASFPSLMN
ncbi:hypothetical protein [Pararhodobacter sp. CCB-MM2]|uniref:hypothetical protein n=1 Tax=Pararhodobacter sp. CCB-MM2 TaxID=1786003 RepID=UPI0008341689|nr:hypothetical protein [Pararhodobacter sp. CCB-MM2]MCA2013889.1 hypothetical protein [Cereibacter sphaeroides]